MKQPVKTNDLEDRIFAASAGNFINLAIELFRFQHAHNELYRKYCDTLHIDAGQVVTLHKIPFLPISFFKTHTVKTTAFEAEAVFESSGTTQTGNSKHYIKDLSLYRKSFSTAFEHFYGSPAEKCILGLMPTHEERPNSSLLMMTEFLVSESKDPLSGFYLHNHEKLYRAILHNEILKRTSILIGLTYALLDFAGQYPMKLQHTIIMETGGMKGRREEMTRTEVHRILQQQLGASLVHSEYGMTELLSQAYSKGDGIFHCPTWMKILLRDEDDPLQVIVPDPAAEKPVNGVINIIDLANIYSCAFIATEDLGKLHPNGSFEVLGRLDTSDARGCSLMLI